jgi:hypothetical protein
MASPSSNSPGLSEVINLTIERFMSEVHTVMPGEVVSYDPSTQTATVQPALKKNYAGQAISLPLLPLVPVIFPAAAGSWLRLPVSAGDRVLLHFSEGSTDEWWVKGGQTQTNIAAKFALGDAFATPGLNPKPNAIVPKGLPTSIELANGIAWLEVTANGGFKLSNGSVELLTLLDTILGHISNLKVVDPISGPLPLDPVSILNLATDRAYLAQLKA